MNFPSTTNAQDWEETIEVSSADEGAPFDITGYGIEIELRGCVHGLSLSGSVQTGHIVILPIGFKFRFPAAEMKSIYPGTYSVFCRVIAPTGETIQVIQSLIEITEGGFR